MEPTKNRKKAPDGFYSAREAIAVIGIPQATFYRLTKRGVIKSTTLPDRKEAIYPKEAIDNYARAIQAHIEQFTNETYSFTIALKEDIPAIYELIEKHGGSVQITPPETILEAWLRKNPESIHVLRRGDKIVGYVSMLPLPLETIEKRMRRELSHHTIPIDDIEPFNPGKPIRVYIADLIVNMDENQSRRLGARLLLEIVRLLHRLGKRGIEISELYTVATSKSGLRICKSLHMTPLPLPALTTDSRVPFKLDITSSNDPQVIEYRRILYTTKLAQTNLELL